MNEAARPGVPITAREVPMLLARHGETADNAGGLILGRRDPPLSKPGRAQAVRLAAAVKTAGVDSLWTSPLLRARQTAAVVAGATGLAPTIVEDLIESDRGDWEGESVAHLARVSPALHAAFETADPGFAFPGGESLVSQVRRTTAALDLIANGDGTPLVVAHAGTIRAAMLAAGRHPPPERLLPHGETVDLVWRVGGDRPSAPSREPSPLARDRPLQDGLL